MATKMSGGAKPNQEDTRGKELVVTESERQTEGEIFSARGAFALDKQGPQRDWLPNSRSILPLLYLNLSTRPFSRTVS